MTKLPATFVDTIIRVNGKTGELWLKDFDQLITYCKSKWKFELLEPYGLSFNFAAPILFKDNTEAVLKLGVSSTEISREASVLRTFNGAGFCKLIDAETDKGILILEKLNPGSPLSIVADDAEACRIAAKLIVHLQSHKTVYRAIFPSVLERGKELEKLRIHFHGQTGPVPEKFVKNAELLLPELVKDIKHLQLFHGDFHHFNILSSGDKNWKLIDPKGLLSEAAFEIVPFLMNNLEGKNIIETITKRVTVFAKELNISGDRILKWGAVQSTVSLWWFVEDGLTFTAHHLEIAGAFYELSRNWNAIQD
jgi:streptomycin 6-kinase